MALQAPEKYTFSTWTSRLHVQCVLKVDATTTSTCVMVSFTFGAFGRLAPKQVSQNSSIKADESDDQPPTYASTTSKHNSIDEGPITAPEKPPKKGKVRSEASKRSRKDTYTTGSLLYAPVTIRERLKANASITPHGPEKCEARPDGMEQLRKCLLEIIAFTFGVNFDTLNDVLGHHRA